MRIIAGTILFLIVQFAVRAQPVNWYDAPVDETSPYSIGTNTLYERYLQKRTGYPVVVAVIDSGVDIEHDDLKDVIWTNAREIPDNGIDDDNNGYVDDIHGWNFIGGPRGEQVAADTYELTRCYANLRQKYQSIDTKSLSKKQKSEYEKYMEYGQTIESSMESARSEYEELLGTANLLRGAVDVLEDVANERKLDVEVRDSLAQSGDMNSSIAANILSYFLQEMEMEPEISMLKNEVLGPLDEGLHYYGTKFKYNWNPDFDPRSIVGDNYDDKNERIYGNNLLKGPDAQHGTHVAGTIAAKRNNGIGIDGIAENVRIMVIRAVPDGDERDKDVANAIRYAVENGASIINMSFGKGISPDKQLVDEAVRYAEKHDVLIVHAAGNSSEDLDNSENYPTDHFLNPKGFLFFKKKKAENWISVGASSPFGGENLAAGFSNFGKKDVDLFAPGEKMLSTFPDNEYGILQGTSMAAPVVSGVAAVLRSYFPALSACQVIEAMIASARPIELQVKKPGTEELVPFSELSVSGGLIDPVSAFVKASQMKGKKKIMTSDKEIRP